MKLPALSREEVLDAISYGVKEAFLEAMDSKHTIILEPILKQIYDAVYMAFPSMDDADLKDVIYRAIKENTIGC
jgi:hypothetical protein